MTHKFWFVVGSQHLYGSEVLKEVEAHAKTMTSGLGEDSRIPFEVVFKGVVSTPEEARQVCINANADSSCSGVIAWMHTFSPSKMWIGGLSLLNKPYLHINTQFNRNLPFESIDMNFMNTNQSAHGDREHGFITARMRMKRKVICGYWEDPDFRSRIGSWMRSAVGAIYSRSIKVMRFGDNMRYVAVTEGDKVQAEKDFGWSVNTYAVGGLAERVSAVTPAQTDDKVAEYKEKYELWKEMEDNWDEIFASLPIEIEVDANITRMGLVNKGPDIR